MSKEICTVIIAASFSRRRESNPDPVSAAKIEREKVNLRHMMFLSVAYAANTGGTGTLTGTGSNLVLKGVVAEMSRSSPINFANWMLYACPMVVLNLLICWLWLQVWCDRIPLPPSPPVLRFYEGTLLKSVMHCRFGFSIGARVRLARPGSSAAPSRGRTSKFARPSGSGSPSWGG